MRFSARSHVGKKRPHNEDSYLVDKTLRLFVVCDGMGGHAAGEVASSLAVRVVREVVAKSREKLGSLAAGTVSQRNALKSVLRNAVRMASLKIYKRAQKDDELRGMGTTLTLLLIVEGRAFVAHVGDTRLYLYREDKVHPITTDHSMLNQLIRAGEVDPDDASVLPFTNALTRAVGIHPDVDVDTLEVDLLPGDVFLLCSDGLHNYFEGDDAIVTGLSKPFDERAEWFIEFANEAGGKDNITAIVVEIEEVGDKEKSARLRLTFDTLRRIPLFRHLGYAELVRVINVSRAREVAVGEVIIRQGDEGDALYIVLEGSVEVEQNGQVVATLDAGRHFGEMSLVDNEPRSATVRAAEDSVLIRVVRKDFYNLLREDSLIAVKLLWNFIQTLSARLRVTGAVATLEAEEPVIDDDDEGPYGDARKSFSSEAYAKTDPNIVVAPDEFDD